jgi:pyruvate kinase
MHYTRKVYLLSALVWGFPGMSVARLNFSHVTEYSEVAEKLKLVREVGKINRAVALPSGSRGSQ